MLRYVYGQDTIVSRFVASMIPQVGWRGFGNCKAIGVIDAEGRLIAGLVYNNWNPDAGTIDINGAALPGKLWLTRETIRHMFEYPFGQCGCQMVIMKVLADHERLLRQLAAYDFTFVAVPRLYGRDRDGVICTLTVEDWANNRFNKRPQIVVRDPLDIPDFLDRRTQEAA
jgi:RimJ/RimL family protein N-acetyltransferase